VSVTPERRAHTRRRPPSLPSMRFNIASMIDVVFLLMIYFMQT
jgi:biopolymer transport protein ExbD